MWARLTALGTVKPRTHLLDNKASAAYKAEIKKNCELQLVPPDNHQRNLAERAIQTFKSHFKVAILAGVAENFPMNLWDRLLPQTVLTLNLLRQSNVALTVLAYQYIDGAFDYNTTRCCWLQWDAQCRYMRTVNDEEQGQQTHQMDGIYAPPQSTTDAMLSIPKVRKANEYQTLCISNTST